MKWCDYEPGSFPDSEFVRLRISGTDHWVHIDGEAHTSAGDPLAVEEPIIITPAALRLVSHIAENVSPVEIEARLRRLDLLESEVTEGDLTAGGESRAAKPPATRRKAAAGKVTSPAKKASAKKNPTAAKTSAKKVPVKKVSAKKATATKKTAAAKKSAAGGKSVGDSSASSAQAESQTPGRRVKKPGTARARA